MTKLTKAKFEEKHPKLYKTYSSKYVAEDVSDIMAHSYWDVLDFSKCAQKLIELTRVALNNSDYNCFELLRDYYVWLLTYAKRLSEGTE